MNRSADSVIIDALMDELSGKRVTVMGLGRFGGGIAVSRWLCEQGARVLVTDRDPAEKLDGSVAQLSGLPIEYRLGEHREADFTSADLIVASPAVPLNNPFLIAAQNAGVPITTEIKLFVERCPTRKTVGVTGTKGKSTTTAMLGEMLRTKFTTWVGGNIGKSLLSDLPKIKSEDVVLLELSSYMLEHLRELKWSPHVALIGMMAIDHVEWHGTKEKYVDAKRNIVRFQSAEDFVVVGEDDAGSTEFTKHTPAQVVKYGLKGRKPFDLKLAGKHNQLNAQAAFAAASALGVSSEEAQSAIKDFGGLPHRLQVVHESNGVRWINDSIATIPEAAIAACEAFESGKVIQIVGGDDKKKLPFDQLCKVLSKRAKAVLCVGKTGPLIASLFSSTSVKPKVRVCETLPRAVDVAKSLAKPGDVVLLSTGCASYDQFVNFEARGDEFARLAKQ